jgi:hypothetical protein
MIELLLLGLALAGVAAISVAIVEALVRRAELGPGLLLGAALLNAILVGDVHSLTLPGGIRVQLHDVAFALVLAAGGRPTLLRDGRRVPARTVHWREVRVD